MTIRTKVLSCLFAVLVLFIGVSLHSYLRSRNSSHGLELIGELFLPLSRQVAQLQSTIHSFSEDMRRYHFSPPTHSDSSFTRMVRDYYPYLIEKRFAAAERLLQEYDREPLKKTASELTRALSEAKATFSKLVAAPDRGTYETNYRKLKLELNTLARQLDTESQLVVRTAQNENRENLFSSLFLSTIVVLIGMLALLVSYRALAPLPLLISSIKKIASGDFQQSLKVKTKDRGEVALLAREYNRMLEALRERDQKIFEQQKELLHSERLAAIGQLSAEIVHEIRNPLNAISLNIDWLESELGEASEDITETLQSVSREVERLHQITESYLVRAKVPVDEGQKTDANDLLQEILEFSKEEHRSRGIDVCADLTPEPVFIRTDRARLKQAFLNVMKNAKEAMPRGGKLQIRTEVRNNLFRIHFSDSGYGMNESLRGRLFQPFFTTKATGTGLGLMVTRNIVEEANGSIECISQVGEGTTFTFSFPA